MLRNIGWIPDVMESSQSRSQGLHGGLARASFSGQCGGRLVRHWLESALPRSKEQVCFEFARDGDPVAKAAQEEKEEVSQRACTRGRRHL